MPIIKRIEQGAKVGVVAANTYIVGGTAIGVGSAVVSAVSNKGLISGLHFILTKGRNIDPQTMFAFFAGSMMLNFVGAGAGASFGAAYGITEQAIPYAVNAAGNCVNYVGKSAKSLSKKAHSYLLSFFDYPESESDNPSVSSSSMSHN